MSLSVQPTWATRLPLQMQSVLFLAARGPDGFGKFHPCKAVVRAYRACVFLAAKYGRELHWGEKADTFMSLDEFANEERWKIIVDEFRRAVDDLPYHYVLHLLHGAEILGYKHPDARYRFRWLYFYDVMINSMHVRPESEALLDARLSDWRREHWER